jgi:hypothetical protein
MSTRAQTKFTISVRVSRQKIGWIVYTAVIIVMLVGSTYLAVEQLQPNAPTLVPIQYIVGLYFTALFLIGLGVFMARRPMTTSAPRPRAYFLTAPADTGEAIWVVDYKVPTQSDAKRVAFYKAVHRVQKENLGKDEKFRSHSCYFVDDEELAKKFLKTVQAFSKDSKLYRATKAN